MRAAHSAKEPSSTHALRPESWFIKASRVAVRSFSIRMSISVRPSRDSMESALGAAQSSEASASSAGWPSENSWLAASHLRRTQLCASGVPSSSTPSDKAMATWPERGATARQREITASSDLRGMATSHKASPSASKMRAGCAQYMYWCAAGIAMIPPPTPPIMGAQHTLPGGISILSLRWDISVTRSALCVEYISLGHDLPSLPIATNRSPSSEQAT
mmetsp:Transcript_19488/g.49547  ORF Transcript_19488/g.49547 Transcript_19488/m.49547 type:complete len:218 (-) Transcript_19488:201-854(-)